MIPKASLRTWNNYYLKCMDIHYGPLDYNFGNVEKKVQTGEITKLLRFEKLPTNIPLIVMSTAGRRINYWNFRIVLKSIEIIHYSDIDRSLIYELVGVTTEDKKRLKKVPNKVLKKCFINMLIRIEWSYLHNPDYKIDYKDPFISLHLYEITPLDEKLVISGTQKKLYEKPIPPIEVDMDKIKQIITDYLKTHIHISERDLFQLLRENFDFSDYKIISIIQELVESGFLIETNNTYKLKK
jgi:hypothetical protein